MAWLYYNYWALQPQYLAVRKPALDELLNTLVALLKRKTSLRDSTGSPGQKKSKEASGEEVSATNSQLSNSQTISTVGESTSIATVTEQSQSLPPCDNDPGANGASGSEIKDEKAKEEKPKETKKQRLKRQAREARANEHETMRLLKAIRANCTPDELHQHLVPALLDHLTPCRYLNEFEQGRGYEIAEIDSLFCLSYIQ